MKIGPVYKSDVAKSIPFDNSTNGFVSTDAQGAIEEIRNTVATSASPGFTYGRSGTLPAGTWLLVDTVPCNKSSRINFLNNAIIHTVFIANEDPNIIKIAIYTHNGNEIGLTLIGTVTTLAQRTNVFTVSISVPTLKQIALKIADDSPSSGKNIDVGLMISGTL